MSAGSGAISAAHNNIIIGYSVCVCIENASDRTEACYIPVVAAAAAECPSAGPESSIAVLLGRDASDPSALISLCCSIHTRTRRPPHTRYSRRRLRPCTSTLGATCPLRARVASQPVPPYTHTHTRTRIYTPPSRESATVRPSGGGYTAATVPETG